MKIYGYVCVSRTDQNEDWQIIAMNAKGVVPRNLYVGKQSGKGFARPQYQKLIKKQKPSDLLYILSTDRRGRNYKEMQEQRRILIKINVVDICVIDMQRLDTRTAKDLMKTLLQT